jgi:hypothetical protein
MGKDWKSQVNFSEDAMTQWVYDHASTFSGGIAGNIDSVHLYIMDDELYVMATSSTRAGNVVTVQTARKRVNANVFMDEIAEIVVEISLSEPSRGSE